MFYGVLLYAASVSRCKQVSEHIMYRKSQPVLAKEWHAHNKCTARTTAMATNNQPNKQTKKGVKKHHLIGSVGVRGAVVRGLHVDYHSTLFYFSARLSAKRVIEIPVEFNADFSLFFFLHCFPFRFAVHIPLCVALIPINLLTPLHLLLWNLTFSA